MTRFGDLDQGEQAEILNAVAVNLGMAPGVIEKDIWVCDVLRILFAIPGLPPMAFKGGTSLSKAYAAVDRFSEDIDVTINFEKLYTDRNPFINGLSGNQLKTLVHDIGCAVTECILGNILPGLLQGLGTSVQSIALSDDRNDSLEIAYRSCLQGNAADYVKQRVLVEFGGRNRTEPFEQKIITSYAAKYAEALAFPEARVLVLKGTRTFWEKVTLIHAEISRYDGSRSLGRYSRHWYDLYKLAKHKIGDLALAEDVYLLADVVQLKSVFYKVRNVQYEDCLAGKTRLIPGNDMRKELEKDYAEMREARMFLGKPPAFGEILEHLQILERDINLSQKH